MCEASSKETFFNILNCAVHFRKWWVVTTRGVDLVIRRRCSLCVPRVESIRTRSHTPLHPATCAIHSTPRYVNIPSMWSGFCSLVSVCFLILCQRNSFLSAHIPCFIHNTICDAPFNRLFSRKQLFYDVSPFVIFTPYSFVSSLGLKHVVSQVS